MPSNLAWAAESFETQLNMHGVAASIPLHFFGAMAIRKSGILDNSIGEADLEKK